MLTLFISDLHLKADRPDITKRFEAFLAFAQEQAKAVYILGDLFHVWSGDDCADSFSLSIADKLHRLHTQGIAIYYMAGNRDFLLGKDFAARAGMTIITEPYRVIFGETACLLTHGDRYCLEDKLHQWFRMLTRHAWFAPLFLKLPASFRIRLTGGIRKRSQVRQSRYRVNTEVSAAAVIEDMRTYQVAVLIHGHTHQPGETVYELGSQRQGQGRTAHHLPVKYIRFVLSDWDDMPRFMCYDQSKGFIFEQIREV